MDTEHQHGWLQSLDLYFDYHLAQDSVLVVIFWFGYEAAGHLPNIIDLARNQDSTEGYSFGSSATPPYPRYQFPAANILEFGLTTTHLNSVATLGPAASSPAELMMKSWVRVFYMG